MENGASGVGLESYMSGTPYGSSAGTEMGDLNKALSALHVTGRDVTDQQTAGSGAPIKSESLERTLKSLEFAEGDLTIYRSIPKLPAYNTVEEYNVLASYGSSEGGFMAEGALPESRDTTYERKAQLVKFIGDVRSVTHQMSLVKTNHALGSMVAAETKNGMMNVLRIMNREIIKADSANVPVQFNGINAQHEGGVAPTAYTAQENVIDLRGATLTDANIDNGSRVIAEAFGNADTLYAAPQVMSGFVANYYDKGRYSYPNAGNNTVGFQASRAQTQYGAINLEFDKFMTKRTKKTLSTAQTSTKAPVIPVIGGTASTVASAVGKFATGDQGDYRYAVSAFNEYGESPLLAVGAATTITGGFAGEVVDLHFTAGTPSGSNLAATAFRVYRSKVGETVDLHPIFEVSTAELAVGFDGAAAGKVRDKNHYITDCNEAILLQNSPDQWALKQLAPIMKVDIAMTTLAYRFAIVQYATPILYTPPKVVRFINIGTATPT